MDFDGETASRHTHPGGRIGKSFCHSCPPTMNTSVREELDRLHASVCKGLADPKRLLIIDALRDGPLSVSEICERLDLPQSNVSQHLAILRDKGLVTSQRDGQFVIYSLATMKIIEAMDLLREVMAEQVSITATAAAGVE